LAYSIKLSNNFGVGVGGRFIYSNLGAENTSSSNLSARPGVGGSADVSLYYNNKNLKINSLPATLAFGLNISNIGPKISYLGAGTGDFIPTNMRLGSALTISLDPIEKNKLTLALDFNKLMVPTPPQRDRQFRIISGRDPREITLIDGMFGSFADAPDGLKEELQEVSISSGAEYSYDNVFFARAGYFSEHKNKGARKYFTLGVGFNYRKFGLDVAYLIPQAQQNPLAETLRFTFRLNFKGNKETKVEGVEVN
jgi:Type IX secretion system protein PorV